jgi:Helix-loop-helix DNA-binding domain
LPPMPTTKGKRDRSGNNESDLGDKSSASNNSKASTVELAIAYIKTLQTELAETKSKLDDRERKLADYNSNGGDQTSQSPH